MSLCAIAVPVIIAIAFLMRGHYVAVAILSISTFVLVFNYIAVRRISTKVDRVHSRAAGTRNKH
jgi:hypothetical protein